MRVIETGFGSSEPSDHWPRRYWSSDAACGSAANRACYEDWCNGRKGYLLAQMMKATTTEEIDKILADADAAQKSCLGRNIPFEINWSAAELPSTTTLPSIAQIVASKGYAMAGDGSGLAGGDLLGTGAGASGGIPTWVYLAGAGALALLLLRKKKPKPGKDG